MISETMLDTIYAIATSEDALLTLLARLAPAFGCRSAALAYLDPTRPAADVALGHGILSGAALVRYRNSFAEIDPAPAAFAALPVGTATATDRLFSPEERATSRFLAEFYYPLGLCEALGATIARADDQFGILAVHRGHDRPPFTDDEIETFGEIAAHVVRAIALRRRFFALARAAEMRQDMLDHVAAGVMTVDACGRLLEANATARAVLGRADGLVLTRSGGIRAVDRAANAALGAALAADGCAAPTIVVAPRADDARPYALRVSPTAGNSRLGQGPCLIQIADDPPRVGNVEQVLAEALGLSVSSARLTAALLRGEDLRSYAKQAGISENTVKFHLKGAFRATGTRRQSELVRLAASILRDLSV